MRSEKEIIIIAAVAENGVIGKDNAMPWNIRGNLAHFKEVTMGFPCVMGRKTWESLPKKPLPGRLNVIISKTMDQEEFTQRHGGTENKNELRYFIQLLPLLKGLCRLLGRLFRRLRVTLWRLL